LRANRHVGALDVPEDTDGDWLAAPKIDPSVQRTDGKPCVPRPPLGLPVLLTAGQQRCLACLLVRRALECTA
jgi:hypothetical protein